ncbi:mercuric transport protein MerTP [Nafulsella turpanensis]|uniref:mercuric transport protein MerTP n=1 Tax=Nafulsella turpanensis TaxID=1265690 RepID=UPI00035F8F47|nr:mercuric transport protein MerTP [Nafulsella turpanensis]
MKKKENNTKLLASGVVAALGASLCCITPVLALMAGIGGAASAFSWLDPFRPFFTGITVLVLGFAWYQKLKPKKNGTVCACDEEKDKKPFLQSKGFLGIVTVLAILLLSFPYYSGAFFSEQPAKEARVFELPDLQQAKLVIKGMTCAGCESSVNHVLKSKEGVMEANASYDAGTAEVSYNPALITPEMLKAAIEKELGYQVTDLLVRRGS